MTVPAGAHWIRFPRFVGDALMMHQATEALRRGGTPVVAWGPAAVTELFEGSAGYAAVVADDPSAKGLVALARLLRTHKPVSVLALPKSLRAPAAAFVARVPRRVGCADGGAKWLLTSSRPYWTRDDHSLDRYRDIVTTGYPELPFVAPAPLRPRAEASEAVAALRRDHAFEAPYAVLALGAASDAKRLSEALFLEMGRRLAGEGLGLVLLGGPGKDADLAARIAGALPGALDRAGRGPWSEAAAWMAGARAVLANDSGLAHLAAACAAPLVTAFGPTLPRHTAPRSLAGGFNRVVRNEKLACLECDLWHCPVEGHPCLDALDPEALWTPLRAALELP